MPELTGIEFVDVLGKGAMGTVYLARQTSLNRYVAAKQILGAWNGDPEMLARFQREARALARMNHTNVVGIYDLTTSGSDIFMIMEYVRGPSLRQLMDRQQLTTGQALRAISDIAAALDYASQMGIIHRDLKPGNVFVTIAGRSKLGDFGLVKMLSGQAVFQTQVGTILGTPSYMSPEQADGRAEVDQRADVYSLAVMTFELLVGRLPFPPVPGSIMATVDAQISQPPPKPSHVLPGFPKQVEEVILEGLTKDPKQRPYTAGEFWRKLRTAADRAWPGWQQSSDLASIALAAAPPGPPAAAPEPSPPVAGAEPPPEIAAAPAATHETVAGPLAPDETVAAPSAPDETVAAAPAPDETVAAAPAPDETVAVGARDEAAPPPAASSAGPPEAAGLAAPAVAMPVYKPPAPVEAKPRRGPGRYLLILVVLLAVVVIGAGAFTYFRIGDLIGPGTPLTVSTVTTSVDKTAGTCPSSTYRFDGHVSTNGSAGDITYEWVKPDGSTTNQSIVSVKKGDPQPVIIQLQFTYQGNGNAEGDAVLRVIKPSNLSSDPAHIKYTCP